MQFFFAFNYLYKFKFYVKIISMEILDLYKSSRLCKVVSNDVKLNMLSHCYMLCTPDDFLLEEFAGYMAKHIFCMCDDAPCNTCVNCVKISHSNMVDLKYYPTTEKTLAVEDINQVVSDCYIMPIENDKKVYILKNFDLCTVQAQNKILKTLEEAPRNVVFILTCTNPSMVLSTICSRAKKIDINLLDTEIIENYLKGLKCENAELVSNMAGGSLSTALKLAKNKDAENIVNLVFELLKDLNTSGDVLKFSSKILSFKKDIHFFLNTLISILRDIAASGANVSFKNRKRELDALATRYSAEAVNQIVNVVVEIFERLEFNGNLNGLIDYLLLKILEVRFLCQK